MRFAYGVAFGVVVALAVTTALAQIWEGEWDPGSHLIFDNTDNCAVELRITPDARAFLETCNGDVFEVVTVPYYGPKYYGPTP